MTKYDMQSTLTFRRMHDEKIYHPLEIDRADMQPIKTVTIRRAIPEDNRLLANLGRQTFNGSFAADNRPEDMRAYLDAAFNAIQQTSELKDPTSIFLIAEVLGEPVGYAHLLFDVPPDFIPAGRPIHLQRIYSVRQWIGRGVGPALIKACIAKALRAKAEGIWLGVWEKNSRALSFYKRWGFIPVGVQPFQLGGDRQTDRVLWLPLPLSEHDNPNAEKL